MASNKLERKYDELRTRRVFLSEQIEAGIYNDQDLREYVEISREMARIYDELHTETV